MKKILFIAALAALAACTTDELTDKTNNDTNPLAGQLHIGAISISQSPLGGGARRTGEVNPSTREWREATGEVNPSTGEWREAAGEVNTRAIMEDGNTYTDDVSTTNRIPSNLAVTAFSEGDRLTMLYSFDGNPYTGNSATLTLEADGTWSISSYVNLKPDANDPDETWAGASIALFGNFGGGSPDDHNDLAAALSIGTIDQKTDQLSAEADDITIDNQPGSPDLGRITARLTHRNALLRLPASSITIADYGEDFGTLQELLAKVGGTYFRFTPVTIGTTDYWQAIVYGSNADFTEPLTEFIAILGPEGGNTKPGKNTFSTDKGSDGNILTDGGSTEIPMKPITIPLSGDGITMERNTRYPLSLTLSPHTATVTVGSSVPGWGTDEETEIIYGGEPLEGTNGNYTASSPRALFEFAAIVSKGGEGLTANCTLTADIDLKGAAWTPIGTDGAAYQGTFDGAGHTIRNLTVSGGSNYQGLFGYIDGATVQNLTVESGTVSGSYGGAIAGSADNSTIENCHNVGVAVTANNYAGGIVGSNNAYNAGTATANATLTACTNSGSVTATGNGSYAGGIVGTNNANTINTNATLTACINTGSVSGSSYAGGIVGYNYADNYDTGSNNATLTACINSGEVKADDKAGGIVGYNHVYKSGSGTATTITTACVNTGEVTGNSAGSIVGWNDARNGGAAIVTHCHWLDGTAGTDIGSNNGTVESIMKIDKTANATALGDIASTLNTLNTGYEFTVADNVPAEITPGTVLFTVKATQP